MKKFSKFEIATIKRTAQNVNPMVTKRAKLMEQIKALQDEYDQLTDMQGQYEASIKTMTGGYTTEDLVTKVVETTNSVDKNGKPIKITKYVLNYPETIIPVVDDAINPSTASTGFCVVEGEEVQQEENDVENTSATVSNFEF